MVAKFRYEGFVAGGDLDAGIMWAEERTKQLYNEDRAERIEEWMKRMRSMKYLSKWVRGGMRYVNHEVKAKKDEAEGPGDELQSLEVLEEFWKRICQRKTLTRMRLLTNGKKHGKVAADIPEEQPYFST